MNFTDCLNELIQTKTFRMFNIEELEKFLTHDKVMLKKLSKNNIFCLSGEKCETLNIVISGEVAVQKFDDNGHYLTITTFNKGQTFGDNLLFGEQNIFPFSIVASTECVILKIHKDVVFKLLQSNEQFLRRFLQNVSNHSFFVGKRMITLTGKSLREKIIEYVKEEQVLQKSEIVKLTHSKKELAEKFSVHRPSLSRELKKMKEDGLIDFDHLTITPLKRL